MHSPLSLLYLFFFDFFDCKGRIAFFLESLTFLNELKFTSFIRKSTQIRFWIQGEAWKLLISNDDGNNKSRNESAAKRPARESFGRSDSFRESFSFAREFVLISEFSKNRRRSLQVWCTVNFRDDLLSGASETLSTVFAFPSKASFSASTFRPRALTNLSTSKRKVGLPESYAF